MQLRSTRAESEACRKAWQGLEVFRGLAWHVHHEILDELLYEDPMGRIYDILHRKPPRERALRLRLFRPAGEKAQKAYDAYGIALNAARAKRNEAKQDAVKVHDIAAFEDAHRQADATYAVESKRLERALQRRLRALHKVECEPDCPWNGQTIFP